jgi:F-type H+-transporting ATPase subunit epsilon
MITLNLVTPQRKIVENVSVTNLKIPTLNGQIEILPGHTELLTILDVGELSFEGPTGKRKFAISYGFCEVKKNKVVVLAETCEENSKIDVGRAKAAQLKVEEKLKGLMTDGEFKKNQLKLKRAVIRQQVANA